CARHARRHTSPRALRGVVPNGRDDAAAALWLDSLLLLSREQEREAGLTRNDYFSLWQAQRYAKFTDDATVEHRSRRVGSSSASLVTVSLPLRRFLRSS